MLLAQAAALGIAPGAPLAAAVSALLYRFTYLAFGGLLAVWAEQMFPESPTTCFSVVFLSWAAGRSPVRWHSARLPIAAHGRVGGSLTTVTKKPSI